MIRAYTGNTGITYRNVLYGARIMEHNEKVMDDIIRPIQKKEEMFFLLYSIKIIIRINPAVPHKKNETIFQKAVSDLVRL